MTMNIATVCQTCGGKSEKFFVALVYCDKCQAHAVHCYCLDVLPETFDEYVVWFCEDCKPEAFDISSSAQVRGSECASLENIVGKKRKRVKVRKISQKSKKIKYITSPFDKPSCLRSTESNVETLKTILLKQNKKKKFLERLKRRKKKRNKKRKCIVRSVDESERQTLDPNPSFQLVVVNFTSSDERLQELERQKGLDGDILDEDTAFVGTHEETEPVKCPAMSEVKDLSFQSQIESDFGTFLNHCTGNGAKDWRLGKLKGSHSNNTDEETESGEIKESNEETESGEIKESNEVIITNASDSAESCFRAQLIIDEEGESVSHRIGNGEEDQRLMRREGSIGSDTDKETESGEIKESKETITDPSDNAERYFCAQPIICEEADFVNHCTWNGRKDQRLSMQKGSNGKDIDNGTGSGEIIICKENVDLSDTAEKSSVVALPIIDEEAEFFNHCTRNDERDQKLGSAKVSNENIANEETLSGDIKISKEAITELSDIEEKRCAHAQPITDEEAEFVSHCTNIDVKDQRVGREKGSNENDIDEQTESGEIKESKEAITDPLDIAESCFYEQSITYEEAEFANHCSGNDEKAKRFVGQKGSNGNNTDEESKSCESRICKEAIIDSSVIMEKSCACSQPTIDEEAEFVNHCTRNGTKDQGLRSEKVSKRNLADEETKSDEIKISKEAITNPSDIAEERCVLVRPIVDEEVEFIKHLTRTVENDWRLGIYRGSNAKGIGDETESDQIIISAEANIDHLDIVEMALPIIDEEVEFVKHLARNGENDWRLGMHKGSNGNGLNVIDDETESDQLKISEEATVEHLDIVEKSCVCAQPIIIPIWRGSLSIFNENFGTLDEVVVHVSTLACSKVIQEAKLLPGSLSAELLPRSRVWPKGFMKWGPDGDSIALYIFPDNERDERIYESLVDAMTYQDLGVRAVVQNAELLIFASTLLPKFYWRSGSKFYLWGVFQSKARFLCS